MLIWDLGASLWLLWIFFKIEANELFLYLVDNMLRSKLVLTEILTSGKKIWFGKRRKFFSIGFVDAPANLKR